MPQFLIIILLILAFVVMAVFVSWIKISYDTFPGNIKPGSEYTIGGRNYTTPDLPHMMYGSTEKPNKHRKIPILDEQLLVDLRKLIDDTFISMRTANVDYWATGGTLISAQLWKHLRSEERRVGKEC